VVAVALQPTRRGSGSTAAQLLFRLVAAAYERRSLAISSHWPFEQWGRFLPEHTTAVSLLDRLLHRATVVVIVGTSLILAIGLWPR
jgi:DNA replication protein DnaC